MFFKLIFILILEIIFLNFGQTRKYLLFICLLFLLIDLIFFFPILELNPSGSSCTTPNDEQANCISIYRCNVLYNAVTSRDPQVIRFLKQSQCGYERDPLVCCGSVAYYTHTTTPLPRTVRPVTTYNNDNNLIPDRSECGFQVNSIKRIKSILPKKNKTI